MEDLTRVDFLALQLTVLGKKCRAPEICVSKLFKTQSPSCYVPICKLVVRKLLFSYIAGILWIYKRGFRQVAKVALHIPI